MDDSKIPWIEKYRPQTLDQIISQDHVTHTLKKIITSRNIPHLIFYGPPGTGKTSAIMAFSRDFFGENFPYMVMELNSSDERGIEIVRTRIKQFVTTKGLSSGQKLEHEEFKLVILDEVDAMTIDAQVILIQVMEKYSSFARFCLICNYINKIDESLLSRCTKFKFSPLLTDQILLKINEVTNNEKIDVLKSFPEKECRCITNNGLMTIIRRSKGDMRKVLNNLQSISMVHRMIDETIVNISLGFPLRSDINLIYESLFNDSYVNSYELITKMIKLQNISLVDILNDVHELILNKLLASEKLEIENTLIHIINDLRFIEYNLSFCTEENIQLSAFIGIFKFHQIPKIT